MTAEDVATLKPETLPTMQCYPYYHLIKFISNKLLTKPKKNNVPTILVNVLNISREK